VERNVESIGIRITHVGLVHTKNMFYSPENAPPREIIHSHIYSRSSVELQSKPCWLGFSSFEYQSAEHKSREMGMESRNCGQDLTDSGRKSAETNDANRLNVQSNQNHNCVIRATSIWAHSQ
jgi:hypothetical protein